MIECSFIILTYIFIKLNFFCYYVLVPPSIAYASYYINCVILFDL